MSERHWILQYDCASEIADIREYVLTFTFKQLGAARTALSAVTEDYDRLSRVLAVRQAYDLVTVDEINDSLLSLKRAVEPQIHELISLAESGLTELQKRERSLYEQVSCHIGYTHQQLHSYPIA